MHSRSRRSRWNLGLAVGVALFLVVLVIAILAPIAFSDAADTMGARHTPSAGHLLGTDTAGHDLLLRSLVATRLTLLMTAGATAIAVIAGVLAGTGVWLMPGRPREICLRVIDGMVAFPGLLLALVVAAILGAGGISAVVAIGVSGIPYFARLTANLAAKVSQQEFITTARLLGVRNGRMVIKHLLPNMAEPLLVLSASTLAQTLTAISALSFVGLGVQSPAYDWGKLLNESLPSLLAGRPYEMVGPAALIILTGLSAILIGDGLAAAANPRSSSKQVRSTMKHSGAPAPEDSYLASVSELRISAGDTLLVKGISFGIKDGEIVGIVGESGSGKTLTAMALARLLPDGLSSTAARLSVDGLDLLRPLPARRMAETVALVYQDPGSTFNPALRMGTQLSEVLTTHKGFTRAKARTRILESLRLVHMTTPELRLRQHPHELSGGMRQRAMIASALASEPRLIIADEPTTALDVTVQADILRELKRINRDYGTSMMFISHDIGVVRAICDRVIVMYRGEIVEEIKASDLSVERAQHSYTRSLLAATPDINAPLTTRLAAVSGASIGGHNA
ncbi:dipeptide/oligopeptide/nickel ABC transporter permease/ATP-binding protein [Arthrobacter sp. NPDC058127]|uniref:dipeptide/oligopeptide/nickel ABC transporter permease/ATP-binding protein n=1 Tax=Arthrobacter sp. NPDC058127 TaxID=3346351 RepID=UPI0036EE1564